MNNRCRRAKRMQRDIQARAAAAGTPHADSPGYKAVVQAVIDEERRLIRGITDAAGPAQPPAPSM